MTATAYITDTAGNLQDGLLFTWTWYKNGELFKTNSQVQYANLIPNTNYIGVTDTIIPDDNGAYSVTVRAADPRKAGRFSNLLEFPTVAVGNVVPTLNGVVTLSTTSVTEGSNVTASVNPGSDVGPLDTVLTYVWTWYRWRYGGASRGNRQHLQHLCRH